MTRWVFDDGGRAAAGFKGEAGDCGTRAIAVATGLPYRQVYDAINLFAQGERLRGDRQRSNARTGVHKVTLDRFLSALGWNWTPTMAIGSGCRVHLCREELPPGRLIVRVSKHITAVVDGLIRDTHDPSRLGTRCVYGYWHLEQASSTSPASWVTSAAGVTTPPRSSPSSRPSPRRRQGAPSTIGDRP